MIVATAKKAAASKTAAKKAPAKRAPAKKAGAGQVPEDQPERGARPWQTRRAGKTDRRQRFRNT